ncbi:MAG: hypothetical protein J5956_14135 [Ruminococcus sp.]|nr:hypothetical protein [Ruminococcus sp.]
MEYRYKLEIELDEDKIRADGEYTVEQLRQHIIDSFADVGITNMVEDSKTMIFIDNTYDFDFFARFGLIVSDLYYDEPWFCKYAKKVLWYNNGHGKDHCEDVIETFIRGDKLYGTA